jgi:hypothetical protein
MHVEIRKAYRILVRKPEGNDHLRDLYIDGRIPLKCFLKEQNEGVDWIHLAKKRVQWRVLVNMVMNCWLPYNMENSLTR